MPPCCGILCVVIAILACGCNTTRYLGEKEYLLQSNAIKLTSDRGVTSRGELSDNLDALVMQKPNTKFLGLPYKLMLYNARYKKFSADPTNVQYKQRTIERPVVYDSMQTNRSVDNMRNYLFNQGYFYARIEDTVVYKGKKAYATYKVNTGRSYLINRNPLRIAHGTIQNIVAADSASTILKQGQPFSMALLDAERLRITNLLKNEGYYRFSQEYISFKIDTGKKLLFTDRQGFFENAINFATSYKKKDKKPTLDVITIIDTQDDEAASSPYAIQNVTVFPDFVSRADARDSTMKESFYNGAKFRYHKYYLKESTIYQHMGLEQKRLYTLKDYDATISRLNSLGVFQSVRVVLVDDTAKRPLHMLNMYVPLTPADRNDFGTSFEVSNGSTYVLGSALTFNYRNRNLFRNATLFSASVSLGLESDYSEDYGHNFLSNFKLLTRNFGVNASLDFPKYLLPISQDKFSKKNLPRTVIGIGTSLLDRVNFFTLSNTTANITYNWRETTTKNWSASPAFINIIRLPYISDSFQQRLNSNTFLKNSYRELFIEGENIAFTYSNQLDNRGRSYSYGKLAVEEAGGVLSGIGAVTSTKNSERAFPFAQYVKFDYDVRRYINRSHSQVALRFYGGVGIPYGTTPYLPYIKQYFVGGPYSIRGWRIRSLGPGSYFDSTSINNNAVTIDRTGDIKIELNGEYRFDIVQLFSGAIKMKGAVFADGGNIWLSRPSTDYPGGDFKLDELGQDIAVSSGAGARFDLAGFFILRIDAAFPIKKPYVPGGGWVVREVDFGNPSWRNQNLILNFAIGYPF
jgi:outer membrane protein insertion porin family